MLAQLRAAPRLAGRWLVVAAALLGLWFLLADTLSGPELGAGLGAAALAAAGALIAARDLRFRPTLAMLAEARRLPARLLRDTAIIAMALLLHVTRVRPVRSHFEREPFRARGNDGRTAARRAVATWMRSLTPNTVVLGFDRDGDDLVQHQLVPARPGRRGRR